MEHRNDGHAYENFDIEYVQPETEQDWVWRERRRSLARTIDSLSAWAVSEGCPVTADLLREAANEVRAVLVNGLVQSRRRQEHL